MKTTKTIMAAALVLAIAATPLLAAPEDGQGGFGGGQRRGPGGPAGPQGRFAGARGGQDQTPMLRMLKALDLTDQQQAKIDDIVAASQEDIDKGRQAVREANTKLREAIADEKDPSTLRQLAASVGAAMGDQAVTRVQLTSKIKAVLTTEQLARYDEIREKMKDRMSQMRGQRGPGAQDGQGRRGQGQGRQSRRAAED